MPLYTGGNLLTGENISKSTTPLLLYYSRGPAFGSQAVSFLFLPLAPHCSRPMGFSERNQAMNFTQALRYGCRGHGMQQSWCQCEVERASARAGAACASQRDSRRCVSSGHPYETCQEHINKQTNKNNNKNSIKLTYPLATVNPLCRHAQQLWKCNNQKAIKSLKCKT